MGNQTHGSVRKRILGGVVAAYVLSVLAVTPILTWEYNKDHADSAPLTLADVMPSTQALIWPSYIWQKLTSPPFEDPLASKPSIELKKFNLIWYYLAEVNNAQAVHAARHPNAISFLAACRNFDDYIGAMHQMIYASHSLDVHVLNTMYPELGSHFTNSWRKGANLMLNACIDGSLQEYMASKAASDEWFSWYEANGTAIEAALKKVAY